MQTTHPWDARLERVIRYSLYVFAAAMPFAIALTQIAVAIAVLAWLTRIVYTRGARWPRLGIEWAFAAFIAAEVLSCIFSTNLGQSLVYLKRLLLLPIVYVVAAGVEDEKTLKHLGLIFIASIALYAVWGISSFFANPEVRVRHIQNSMTAGGITMIGATVTLALALRLSERRYRLLFAVATVVILGCLLLTATRGSWLGFFVAALFLIGAAHRKLLLIVPVVAAAFYLLQPEQFAPRIRHFFDPTWGTNAKRLHWWSIGWEIYKDHPVVGIGDVGTTPMYVRYAPPGETELVGHFHSNYVHIAVTLGSVGLAAFLFMIGAVFVRIAQQLRRCRGVPAWSAAWTLAALAVFLAFNINGFFEWNFGDQEIITMVWFCTGLGLRQGVPAGQVCEHEASL